MTDLHAVNVVCDEGHAFIARHDDLNETQRATGGLLWGLMRAIAECPDCPGVFRASPDHWQTLVCPQCRGVWRYQDTPASPPPARRRRKRAS